MQKTNEKKALVITGLNKKLLPLFPEITNKKEEELLIATSFGTIITNPYDCTVRNMMMAVYAENIKEIYLIGEKDSKEHKVDGDEIVSKIKDAGISNKTIETIEYIDVAGNNLSSWLAGKQDVKQIITENVELIKSHPLLPKTLSVHGFIVNAETGEWEAVE
ncbi:carbonic anhydrase [Domibacillus epiphyticus]|nr:hypothetical protein [Domibacillus epiphyticus]